VFLDATTIYSNFQGNNKIFFRKLFLLKLKWIGGFFDEMIEKL